jgi:hypothetical protein
MLEAILFRIKFTLLRNVIPKDEQPTTTPYFEALLVYEISGAHVGEYENEFSGVLRRIVW